MKPFGKSPNSKETCAPRRVNSNRCGIKPEGKGKIAAKVTLGEKTQKMIKSKI